jgi:tripartite-type tricarboxylate transporter receptor subunit TctC
MRVTTGWTFLVAAGVLGGPAIVLAQYPTKPVRLIVPYPPGGGSDGLGRIVALKLGEALGQQMVIDNRPGAGANIGAELAARAQADGHTLFMANVAHAINVSYYRKLGYDLLKDFAAVSLVAETPHILVVHPSLPVKSVRDLIALARTRPGQLDYSSSGAGGSNHLAGELFAHLAGVKMTHIAYNGGGPAAIALVGGQVPIGFPTTPSAIPQVKSGKLRGLAVTSARRSASIAELPTVAEAGLPGYAVSTWYGILAPTATPREIIERLSNEAARVIKLPDAKERLDGGGFEPIGALADPFAAYLRDEVTKWAKVIQALGTRAD